jgi:hypothetical protein
MERTRKRADLAPIVRQVIDLLSNAIKFGAGQPVKMTST